MKNNNKLLKCFMFIISASFATVVNATDWHDLTQAQRNQKIVDEANKWNDGDYGGSCKVWVQMEVVARASSGKVYLPGNSNNDAEWLPDPEVIGVCKLLDYVKPGEIIQIDLKNSNDPHTLIVVANDGSNITVKESNWCLPACNLVGTRKVSYDKFYSQVNTYTVYSVL